MRELTQAQYIEILSAAANAARQGNLNVAVDLADRACRAWAERCENPTCVDYGLLVGLAVKDVEGYPSLAQAAEGSWSSWLHARRPA
ncbi:MAG: hypothetical protein ACYTG0_33440 [Planctomycetota bacterium]|jgi:hypothetical protein